MTREPLMLSDTAMVLLRDYIEAKNHNQETLLREVREILPSVISLNDIFNLLMQPSSDSTHDLMNRLAQRFQAKPDALSERAQEIEDELIHELWLLWSSPDLVPIRSLEWHLVFDADLMAEAAKIFVARPQPSNTNLPVGPGPVNMVSMRHIYPDFMNLLTHAYQTALAARYQDHS